MAKQGFGASVMGYEVHEDEACTTHRKNSPNFYPLGSHLILYFLGKRTPRNEFFVNLQEHETALRATACRNTREVGELPPN